MQKLDGFTDEVPIFLNEEEIENIGREKFYYFHLFQRANSHGVGYPKSKIGERRHHSF